MRVSGGFEPPHLPLPLARRVMGDLRSIVLVSRGAVNNRRHGRTVGCRVAAKLVRDQASRRTALPFQQLAEKPLGRTLIAPRLDKEVDHITILIDGTPEILAPALDVHEQLVQVPRVPTETSGRA